jgi:hypothetical protein
MGRGELVLAFVVIAIFVISCAAQQTSTPPAQQPSRQTTEQTTQQPTPQKQTISASAEVLDMLNKHKTKVSSIQYNYKGPETSNNYHKFYIKGTKIKYEPYLAIKTLDREDSYDTIFIDTAAKTAQSYCIAAYCKYSGLKENLNYDDAYIDTIFDWLKVTQATKVGEEVIDSRSTWKLQTNKGIIWVDTFYGVPLKADADGVVYKFEQLSVGSVTDADILPK